MAGAVTKDGIAAEPAPAPGRSCTGCTMCCKLLGIEELNKPRHKWCPNCDVGAGCKIYDQRPGSCRTFNCRWLIDPAIPDHWAPKNSRMVLMQDGDPPTLGVVIDTDRAEAWKKEPFQSDIRDWVAQAEKKGGRVFLITATQHLRMMQNGGYRPLSPAVDGTLDALFKR